MVAITRCANRGAGARPLWYSGEKEVAGVEICELRAEIAFACGSGITRGGHLAGFDFGLGNLS